MARNQLTSRLTRGLLSALCQKSVWAEGREWFFSTPDAVLCSFPPFMPQQFRARGRGWGRGTYSGNNNNNSNNDFQKRNREEEWDPEYTPKSKKYYLVCVWDKQEGPEGLQRTPWLIPRLNWSVQDCD